MENKWHFLTASTSYYSGNNFNDLLEEEGKYDGYIYWHIGKHQIEVNDKCAIYYSNLPDNSKRLLFIGTVVDSDYGKSGKSICPDAKKGESYAKLKLKSISLEDSEKFALKNLREKYNLINKKGRFSYLHIDLNKHKKLIQDIEKSINDGTHGLKYVNEYFINNFCTCEFGCKTFIEENGFYYMERHHLVTRNLIKKYSNISNIDKSIDDERNLFNLCPMCHMKIHHAKKDERREKIKKLYLKNKSFFDDNFNQIKNGKDTLNWLFTIYKCGK